MRPGSAAVPPATAHATAVAQVTDRAHSTTNKVVAALVLIAIAARVDIAMGITVGYVLAAGFAPVWLRVLSQYRGAWTLMIVGATAIGSGFWLTELSSGDHEVSLGEMVGLTAALGGILCSVGFVLWARTVLPDAWVAIWFGVGLFLSVSPVSADFRENPWRFGYSFAVTILLLGMARRKGRWLELAAALLLTAISLFGDGRSSFAILLLTVVLVAWQMRPARPSRTKSGTRVVLALGALGVVIYNLGQEAILAGYLGASTRERTVAQLEQSGSLILGGRPEATATIALLQHQPWGYGTGTLLNTDDILVAKTGMSAINYEPNNGYVEKFMFGDRVELHSVIGDLWVHFGIPGLVLGFVILTLVLRGVGVSVASNAASAVFLFLAVSTIWLLFFGPLYSASRVLILVLGLGLLRIKPAASAGDTGLARQPALALRAAAPRAQG